MLQEVIPFFKFKCENDNNSGEYILNMSMVTTETNEVNMQISLYD